MKKIILLVALTGMLNGCAWFRHGEAGGEGSVGHPSPDSTARGTTGVSSGADAGAGITGSDLAPPTR